MLNISNEIQGRFISVNYNPTAENMAHHMYQILWDAGLPVKQVLVRETLTGWAVADDRGPVELTARYSNIAEMPHE